MSAADAGPSLASHASSSATEWADPNTWCDRRPKRCGSRALRTGKRRTRTPFTSDSPAGSSFRHVM